MMRARRQPPRPAAVLPGTWRALWRACVSKREFPTRDLAEAWPGRGRQVPYRCPFGDHWHLTTPLAARGTEVT